MVFTMAFLSLLYKHRYNSVAINQRSISNAMYRIRITAIIIKAQLMRRFFSNLTFYLTSSNKINVCAKNAYKIKSQKTF